MILRSAMLSLLVLWVGHAALADEPDPRTEASTFTKACALSDLDLVVALDVVGNVNPTSPLLVLASELLYSAREECNGGHEVKALQMYQAGVQMLSEQSVARAK